MLWSRNFSRLRSSRATASGPHSTEQTSPSGQARAAATETDPVPAPMSQSTDSGPSSNRSSTTDRTSSRVMGTPPRSKSASRGRPKGGVQGAAFRTSIRESGSKSRPARSAGAPRVTRSSG